MGKNQKSTKRSMPCAVLCFGSRMVAVYCISHKIAGLPSAESETYSCFSRISDAIILSRLISWMAWKPKQVGRASHFAEARCWTRQTYVLPHSMDADSPKKLAPNDASMDPPFHAVPKGSTGRRLQTD